LQEAPDVISKRIGNNQAAGTPVDVAEFLAGFSDHGGVNDWQHFFNVVEKQAIEKHLVGVLELAKINVALEIVVLTKIGLVSASRLFFDGFHDGREQAIEAEGLALLVGKSSPFVQ